MIHDLLYVFLLYSLVILFLIHFGRPSPSSSQVQIIGNGILAPLHEEVITSLKVVKEVIE